MWPMVTILWTISFGLFIVFHNMATNYAEVTDIANLYIDQYVQIIDPGFFN